MSNTDNAATQETTVADGETDRGSEAVETLRRAIVRGEFAPNERLVEVDLSQRFGFSRGAIRTALLELAHEGLVERVRNRGARVRAVSFEEAIELTEVRMVLEGLCAAKAAENASDADCAALWHTFESMRAAASRSDLVEYSDLNHVLHDHIRKLSRHTLATRLLERLRNQSVRHQFLISFVPGRVDKSLSEHAGILEAITARDPHKAREAMEAHLQSVVGALKQIEAMNLPAV